MYKGIAYMIVKVRDGEWAWEIRPTLSVLGLKALSGKTAGTLSAATDAVKLAIETQLGAMMRR